MADRIRITYQALAADADVPALADAIAREQTVELPPATYPEWIERDIVGRVERHAGPSGAPPTFEISYDPAIVGADLLQFVNVLYGNVSLIRDVRIVDVVLPASVVRMVGHTGVGLAGLRARTGVEGRALLVGAVKPIGLAPEELATRGAQLARGGLDLIKDDHGLGDQAFAPFRDRVERCQEAIAAAGPALYAPNVTGPLETLPERLAHVRACGCKAVVMSPMLMGLGALRMAGAEELAVLTHPTMTGGVTGPAGGLDPAVLFGVVMRLAGADAVVIIAAGGRFPVPREETVRLVERIRSPLHGVPPALPVLGGGIAADDAAGWVTQLGADVGFLVGSSLYATGDLEGAARRLRDAVEHAGG